MTNHTITLEGKRYYTTQVVDSYTGETYDQTAIFCCDEHCCGPAPDFVGYYYGEPNLCTTAQYVDEYRSKQPDMELTYFCKRLTYFIDHKHQPMFVAETLNVELLRAGVDEETADDFAQAFAAVLQHSRRIFGRDSKQEA